MEQPATFTKINGIPQGIDGEGTREKDLNLRMDSSGH
jgi:hypothetical protein